MALLSYANRPDSIVLEVRWGGWGYAPFLNERVSSVRDDGYSDKAAARGGTCQSLGMGVQT